MADKNSDTPSQTLQPSSVSPTPAPSSRSGRRSEPPDPASLVEVYVTDNEMAALFVRDEILSRDGIYTALHYRRSNAIPAPASLAGEIGIAVPKDQAREARARLATARQDGVLLDGQLVELDLA